MSELRKELERLSKNAFHIIELVEVTGIKQENEDSFKIIRKKLLNLANDILRLEGKMR